MGWISDRHHQTGQSIGTGPKDGKHKGPLRKIVKVLRSGRGMFETDQVLMECGHEGRSYGGVRQVRRAARRGEAVSADDLAPLLPTTPIRRVIVCGSRKWTDQPAITFAIRCIASHQPWPQPVVIHGAARGADKFAGDAAFVYGLTVLPMPVIKELDGEWPGAGHNRNRRMLDLAPDLVLAFKDNFDYTVRRGGTENMCRIALEAKVPALLYSTGIGWQRLTLNTKPVEMLT